MKPKERRNTGVNWFNIIKVIESIEEKGLYIRVNRVISFFLDDKIRCIGASSLKKVGKVLDAGTGPGLTFRLIEAEFKVGFDASLKMLKKMRAKDVDVVCGVFEYMPFRRNSFDGLIAAYSFRDSFDKAKALAEFLRVASRRIVLVDIGKPCNPLFRIVIGLYIKYLVPVIAALLTGDFKNEWWSLYETYEENWTNCALAKALGNFGNVIQIEKMYGGLQVTILDKK